jgi:hypothetical protein
MLLQESMHNVGYHVTRGHKDVYTIQEGNLLELSFKHYYKIDTSEMCALLPKPPNPMQYAKECTKQWEMS